MLVLMILALGSGVGLLASGQRPCPRSGKPCPSASWFWSRLFGFYAFSKSRRNRRAARPGARPGTARLRRRPTSVSSKNCLTWWTLPAGLPRPDRHLRGSALLHFPEGRNSSPPTAVLPTCWVTPSPTWWAVRLDEFVDMAEGTGPRRWSKRPCPACSSAATGPACCGFASSTTLPRASYQCTVHTLVRNGQDKGICVLARDITARARKRERASPNSSRPCRKASISPPPTANSKTSIPPWRACSATSDREETDPPRFRRIPGSSPSSGMPSSANWPPPARFKA